MKTERLTTENEFYNFTGIMKYKPNNFGINTKDEESMNNVIKLLDKLGQLEDIEEKHNMSIDEMDAYITEHKKIDRELGIELSVLFNALKSKQCGLRYFDKTDAFVNKCEVGWYVQMIMYGWIPLKDFIKSLTRKELEK